MPQYWYGFYSGFSGQVFYEQWMYQIFNIIFTCMPAVIYALTDQEHSRETLMSEPKYYKIGTNNEKFTSKIFWMWQLYGIL